MRMRRRRADRCLVRASAALDADVPEIAQQLLEEARMLHPTHPELQEVEERLVAAASTPAAAAPARDRPLSDDLTWRELFVLLVVGLALVWAAASIEPAAVKTLLKQLLTTAGSAHIYVSPSA